MHGASSCEEEQASHNKALVAFTIPPGYPSGIAVFFFEGAYKKNYIFFIPPPKKITKQ